MRDTGTGVSACAVGLDVGTSGVKGLAIDHAGGVLARAEAGYPLSTPRVGWAEQDPEDWWQASAAVLERLRADAGPPAGIGLCGQMHGLVALDAGTGFCARRSSGTISARLRNAPRSRRRSGSSD